METSRVVTLNWLLPCSSVVNLHQLTKLSFFLAMFPNLSNIPLEMIVVATSGKFEPKKKTSVTL